MKATDLYNSLVAAGAKALEGADSDVMWAMRAPEDDGLLIVVASGAAATRLREAFDKAFPGVDQTIYAAGQDGELVEIAEDSSS